MYRTFLAAALLGVIVATLLAGTPRPHAPRGRVGVYDHRAIAMASAPSSFGPTRRGMERRDLARAAGDAERAETLEAGGGLHRGRRHRQGPGRVPVGELLAPIEDRLPEVARRAGVDAIVSGCSYTAPGVEVVDVTMELVMLFQPSARTLEMIRSLEGRAPVDLDLIERSHDR